MLLGKKMICLQEKSCKFMSKIVINNLGAEPRGMLFSCGVGLGFNTLLTAAEPRGIKPSPRINMAIEGEKRDFI
jgi:hypothetical protein